MFVRVVMLDIDNTGVRGMMAKILWRRLCAFPRRRILWAAACWQASGVVTLTRVKHRRELLFASLPTLFAIHQFTEGFVWLGLDGMLGSHSAAVTRDMGAAFMLYAQGLLPFLLPLSVMLFEQTRGRRRAMLPFVALGLGTTLVHAVGADCVSHADLRQGQQHCVHQSGDEQYRAGDLVCGGDVRLAVLLQGEGRW